MKTLIIAALATMALGAAGANVAGAREVTVKHTARHTATHATNAKQAAKKVTAGSKVTSSRKVTVPKRVLPLYIHVPGLPPALTSPTADDCIVSGNMCTNEQLCEIWGTNCSTAMPAATPVDAAPPSTP